MDKAKVKDILQELIARYEGACITGEEFEAAVEKVIAHEWPKNPERSVPLIVDDLLNIGSYVAGE